jgi:hypothetical protein
MSAAQSFSTRRCTHGYDCRPPALPQQRPTPCWRAAASLPWLRRRRNHRSSPLPAREGTPRARCPVNGTNGLMVQNIQSLLSSLCKCHIVTTRVPADLIPSWQKHFQISDQFSVCWQKNLKKLKKLKKRLGLHDSGSKNYKTVQGSQGHSGLVIVTVVYS